VDRERKERIATNEAAARELNEKLGMGTFLCECGDIDCSAAVRMPRELYDSIRADAMLFFAIPGHEIPEAEDVVKRHEDFVVLRKHDDVADIARGRDPRRPRR
jgi:hypothetical protein